MTVFEYRVCGNPDFVSPDHALWNQKLPSGPSGAARSGAWTYGQYFQAVSGLLDTHGTRAFGIPGAAFEGPVSISLEKHGAMYHPGRITACVGGMERMCAVNVAASGAGDAARREFETLSRLSGSLGKDDIPRVHVCDTQAADGVCVTLFTADWLRGMYEWHLTMRPDGSMGGVIWAGDRNIYPDAAALAGIFRSSAAILTRLYDLDTGAQVFPWHHAAGDFIVSADASDVKLITVRQYGQMMDLDPEDAEARLMALLFFVLNLSVRIRLDRLDGIGAFAWADALCFTAAMNGLWDALEGRSFRDGLSARDLLAAYVAEMDMEDLADLLHAVVASYHPDAPEHPLIRENFDRHQKETFHVLKEIFCG